MALKLNLTYEEKNFVENTRFMKLQLTDPDDDSDLDFGTNTSMKVSKTNNKKVSP